MRNVKQSAIRTELHTSHLTRTTPEQVRAKQKADAEKDRAAIEAKLPAKVAAPTAVAVPDKRSTVDRILDEVAPAFLPTINFDGKAGHFALRDNGEVVSPDTRWIAHANSTRLDRIRFNGDGEQPTRVGGPIFDDDYELPERETLGETDEAKWPISDLTGKPSDPWQLQFSLPLENSETSDVFAFTTMSKTGRVAMGRFLRAYNRMRMLHPDELPIVQLRTSSYEHKTFGKVFTPALVVVGRAKADGTQASNARPLSLAEEMDDELPSFESKKF